MAYVITDACTKDFLCVAECVTGAIAPTPDHPAAAAVSQVYIDPDLCLDCGYCAAICSQGAIFARTMLPADKAHFARMNWNYFN
jgi:NAD-dependent dihydropyrimidine dehydrogenase PreA subunit